MASSSPCGSGTSSGSTLLATSGSEGDQQHLMDQKKRKRMLSNRESARRSRLRKQNQLDDLTAEAGRLQEDNGHALAKLKEVAQLAMAVEADNSVMRAQIAELSTRLQSLDQILRCLNGNSSAFTCEAFAPAMDGFFVKNPWGSSSVTYQGIMASPDLFQY